MHFSKQQGCFLAWDFISPIMAYMGEILSIYNLYVISKLLKISCIYNQQSKLLPLMMIQNPGGLIVVKFWARYRQNTIQNINNSDILQILQIISKNNYKEIYLHQLRAKQLMCELILILLIRKSQQLSKQRVGQILRSVVCISKVPKNLQIKLQLIEYIINPQQSSDSDLLLQYFKGVLFLNKSLSDLTKKYIEQMKIINEDIQSTKDKIQENIYKLLLNDSDNIKQNSQFICKIIQETKIGKKKNNNIFYNKKFCSKIKSLILRSSNRHLIQLFFNILNQLSKNSKSSLQYSNINVSILEQQIVNLNDITVNQHLYRLCFHNDFSQYKKYPSRHMNSLQYYLFKYALLNHYCLVQNYFPSMKLQIQANIPITFTSISKLIKDRDHKLWGLIRGNIHTLPPIVLKYFLIESGFSLNNSRKQKIKQRLRDRQNSQKPQEDKQNTSIDDPLQFLSIKRKFWLDSFSGQLLSICLWIIADCWLKRVKAQNCKNQIIEKVSNQEYRTILHLVIIQFALSIQSQPNLLTKYGLIENSLYSAMLRLPSFATIAYQNKNLQVFPWKNFIAQQIPSILTQQKGFYIINALKKSFLKNSSSNQNNIVMLMIQQAQNEVKNKNSLNPERKKQLLHTLSTITDSQNNSYKKLNSVLKFLCSQ